MRGRESKKTLGGDEWTDGVGVEMIGKVLERAMKGISGSFLRRDQKKVILTYR